MYTGDFKNEEDKAKAVALQIEEEFSFLSEDYIPVSYPVDIDTDKWNSADARQMNSFSSCEVNLDEDEILAALGTFPKQKLSKGLKQKNLQSNQNSTLKRASTFNSEFPGSKNVHVERNSARISMASWAKVKLGTSTAFSAEKAAAVKDYFVRKIKSKTYGESSFSRPKPGEKMREIASRIQKLIGKADNGDEANRRSLPERSELDTSRTAKQLVIDQKRRILERIQSSSPRVLQRHDSTSKKLSEITPISGWNVEKREEASTSSQPKDLSCTTPNVSDSVIEAAREHCSKKSLKINYPQKTTRRMSSLDSGELLLSRRNEPAKFMSQKCVASGKSPGRLMRRSKIVSFLNGDDCPSNEGHNDGQDKQKSSLIRISSA